MVGGRRKAKAEVGLRGHGMWVDLMLACGMRGLDACMHLVLLTILLTVFEAVIGRGGALASVLLTPRFLRFCVHVSRPSPRLAGLLPGRPAACGELPCTFED
jgi:hypothetical protein